ncbi:FAD-dependent pyridine nucleotide-disulfide oxidoreductase [Thioalkalivibrio nitratireducens DSM 14787]|uniref:FAD-dependent pyridine nucleotide-disulfide oxidoreductase n=1 Tax=Thioalkalivibrio nitratireducens (strain DSM 14787 / UNIQEM 213 / ALEN2) TaxID=1255043 RepID=L0DY64_THIND|nr:FAD-dependent oxidoreductase [Thioalkalivibrio nitratireducens]AGA33885.1 FAD-dependent pyridine nucleotide-disulfide oxidoreductase [Thioalkalivibrio nitratireducens DSM 14787]
MRVNRTRWILLAAVVLAVVAFFAFDLDRLLDFDTVKAAQGDIEAYRDARPVLASLLYFGVYVAVTALSLPGATVMTLAGGAVFGLGWGLLLVSFASTFGATLAFLIVRLIAREPVQRRYGDKLKVINAGIEREGAFYLFALRLVPLFPFFLINIVMALTPMRTWTFYWVSQVGMLAGTAVYVNAGTQLGRLDSPEGILSPTLILSFALLGIFPLFARRALEVLRRRRVYRGWERPRRYDRNLIVIGAGAAGLVSAYIAATVKAKVTLVEKHRMGGDCLNYGCVPSKALIRTARLLDEIRRSADYGIRSARVDFDFGEAMERVRRVIAEVAPHDSRERYEGLGVEVLEGTARLTGPWSVEITGADGTARTLTSRAIVLATGAEPLIPPLPGLAEAGYLTSDTVWNLRACPRRLVVLGGGPIGCELAQTFHRLGARVILVHRGARLLPREDPEISEMLQVRLLDEGVDLRLRSEGQRVETGEAGKRLVVRRDGREEAIELDEILVAVGRAPRLEGFGLDALGIRTGRTIEVNEFLQATYPNIYACGDAAGRYQFTHVAAHMAWFASVNALFGMFRRFRVDYSVIPWTTFTDPEIARVGLSEQEAREKGIPFEVTTYGIDDLDRAIADGEARGMVKVLTPPGKDRILGVTIAGHHAGELLAEFVLAMKAGLGLNRILGTIHVYPTMAEANKYVAGEWKKAHKPERVLQWLQRFHAWRLS